MTCSGSGQWLSNNPGLSAVTCVDTCDAKVKSCLAGATCQCLDFCPALQYAVANAVCAACDTSCLTCHTRTGGCVTCGTTTWLSNTAGLAGVKCEATCNAWVKDKAASYPDATCIPVCPAMQYAPANAVCQSCTGNCLSCDPTYVCYCI